MGHLQNSDIKYSTSGKLLCLLNAKTIGTFKKVNNNICLIIGHIQAFISFLFRAPALVLEKVVMSSRNSCFGSRKRLEHWQVEETKFLFSWKR